MKKPAILFLSALFISFIACKKEEKVMTPSLYDRLGGKAAIEAVTDQFITNVVAETQTPNTLLKRTFTPLLNEVAAGNTTGVTALRNNLVNQIGEATGGPLKYTGKDMVTAHKGMNITDAEFGALVTALGESLNKFNVPAKEQGELVNILGSLKGDIVGK